MGTESVLSVLLLVACRHWEGVDLVLRPTAVALVKLGAVAGPAQWFAAPAQR